MTIANPQHARINALAQGWRAFRHWRRARPFWGGLLTTLAGLEIFATTQMSLGGLSFQMGPSGFLSWLIPTILVACGLLMVFSPQQRMFYAIVAAMTAVFSLIGVNLGGFFIGLLLGMVGSALGFAWTPTPPAPAVDGVPDGDVAGPVADDSTMEELFTGPLSDTIPAPRNPLQEPVPDETPQEAADERETAQQEPVHDDADVARPVDVPDEKRPPGYGPPLPRRDVPLFAVTLILLSLSAVGVVTLHGGTPAYADPCKPVPSASPSAPSVTPTASPGATPAASSTSDGNLITDLVDGVAGLLGLNQTTAEPSPTASPLVEQPTPTPAATQPADNPASPKPEACPNVPSKRGGGDPGNTAAPEVKNLDTPPGQPAVAKTPSLMTGSKVTMYDLKIDGIVDLPTVGGGTIRALQFSMDKAVTPDFQLSVAGPAGKTLLITSSALTVDGHVTFYATRFTGKILGIPLTLTPASPLPPDGIPLTMPLISFDDPEIELAFVHSDTLTAPHLHNAFPS